MLEHLGTWTAHYGYCGFELRLWDTGRTDSYGKSELAYALTMQPDDGVTFALIEGDDFRPSPLEPIDSDKTAGALLSFFAAYGESIRWSGDDADVPEFTTHQREALAVNYEALGDWSRVLEEEDTEMAYETTIAAAEKLGEEHGQAAGTWVVDGNTSEETARAILAGLEDGDPAVYDQLPSSPLSGEWAGDPLPRDVLEDLGLGEDDDVVEDALRAYEDGFSRGVEEQVSRAARAVLGLNVAESATTKGA